MGNLLNRITVVADICNGKPTIRGNRLTVRTLLGHLAAGDSVDDLLEMFPFLEKEDISAALEYAALLADRTVFPLQQNKEVA